LHDERQEWINKRAYGLWEAAGRPHGQDHEHWAQAVRERDELEKVALPEHLKRNRNSVEADAATRAAVASTRRTLPDDGGEPSSAEASPSGERQSRKTA
jgi:hypothetical protein